DPSCDAILPDLAAGAGSGHSARALGEPFIKGPCVLAICLCCADVDWFAAIGPDFGGEVEIRLGSLTRNVGYLGASGAFPYLGSLTLPAPISSSVRVTV